MSRPGDRDRKAARLFDHMGTVEDECRTNGKMARFGAAAAAFGTTIQIADFVASGSWLAFAIGALCFGMLRLNVRNGTTADRDLKTLGALRLSLINHENLMSDERSGLINEGAKN